MSSLGLTNEEARLFTSNGWEMKIVSGDPEFSMNLGQRYLHMRPVVKRLLKPMSFRSQAQRYDSEYDDIAIQIGWGGRKAFGAGQKSKAMSTFKIEKVDIHFARDLTEILKEWAQNADPKDVVKQRIDSRKKVRWSLSKADFIDYAYLHRTEDLEKISLEERDDGTEFISPQEDVGCLRKAIEVSKRP